MTGADRVAVVVGAGGALGRALAEALVAQGRGPVHALSRGGEGPPGARAHRADATDEASLRAAAGALEAPPALVVVATGLLTGAHARPERRLAELDAEGLAESFRVNAIGPALAAKVFAPRLARDRPAVFAALSARVGSLADNRLGGWYGYRASKAALNMVVRCAAIELARTHTQAACVALHPGTVATPLSAPFLRGAAAARAVSPAEAASRLLALIDRLRPADTGAFLDHAGRPVPW